MQVHSGELAALLTVVFWTITAMAFESASKKVGSLVVNVIRLFFALVLLSLFSLFTRDRLFPGDASLYQWTWLAASGLVGFVVGDYCLFKAFERMGARITMLIQALVPPVTVLLGWAVLGEVLSLSNLVGMVLTLLGIGMVILVRKGKEDRQGRNFLGLEFKVPFQGLAFAVMGALGQSVGLILSKKGMGSFDPFAASQIRVMTGALTFALIFSLLKRWPEVWSTLKDSRAMRGITTGAVFGPFLGVAFSLIALQNTKAGIASTIMALVPVTIIIPSWILFRDRPKAREIIGALVAVGGVALFFVL